MKISHLRAVEKQAEWFHWLTMPHPISSELLEGNYLKVMKTSGDIFAEGETLYMNATFCDLVDHARRTVPDDLQFQASWVPCAIGFMWLETPFAVPQHPTIPYEVRIRAIGWRLPK